MIMCIIKKSSAKKFKRVGFIFILCVLGLLFNFFKSVNYNIKQSEIKFNDFKYVEIIKGNAQGFIGDKFQTAFFKFIVKDIEFIDIYEGYRAQENNQLIDAIITFENTNINDESQMMFRNDFQVQWHNIEYDFMHGKNFAYGLDIENSSTIFPVEFEQDKNKKDTFHIVYEVPLEADTFSISYLEKFDDGTQYGRVGDAFWVYFKK